MAAMALLAVGAGSLRAAPVSDAVIANKRCIDCHGQRKIIDLPIEERRTMLDAPPDYQLEVGPREGLYVTAKHLGESVHKGVTCVECHTEAEKLPHAPKLAPPSCAASCHDDVAVKYNLSTHAEVAAEKPDAGAPLCVTCHGGHSIKPKSDRTARTYPLNVINLCADCHQQHKAPTPSGHESGEFIATYLESVHGKAVAEAGLIVAATCVDCHHAHDVLPAANPESSVSRMNVPLTCGRCHVGIEDIYKDSVHGQKLAAGDEKAPVCTSCHTAHGITRASEPAFKLDIINECGDCHDKPIHEGGLSLYETYRNSYHGQVTALGSTRGAKCSDCHGAHDILPESNPASRVSPQRRAETCGSCHPGASASFAQFMPHADYTVPDGFPLLHYVWLYFMVVISSTFAFFGMHSVFWAIRSTIIRIKHGKHKHDHDTKPGIRRFQTLDRVNHALMVVSFFGLTLTGMPLFFSDQPWAQTMANLFGGAHSAGVLHRVFAIMLIANFVIHIYNVISRIRKYGIKSTLFSSSTLLPRPRDLTDMLAMLKWFFVGGKQPTFSRWTYWEKFDYWAEIFGTFVIGGSGIMLWFPNFCAQIMPGWMFNIATVVHGYEALLAVGFIFTIHFFNANLRPEKFPVDTVIFTGHMPEEEFIHERGDEYAEVVKAGQLDSLRVPPTPAWKRRIAIVAGVIAMAIGITMVALIVLAGLKVL
ncbi:hypothetical protein HED60_01305 [Planctomycetales bacterium ZRK34]|nr:hypothetical protein HED60_01305 [Planctomycetales bacterium ZRK34]